MAGKKQLPPVRAVGPDEKAPPATMTEAVQRGSELDAHMAMLRVLAAHIDSENTLARDLSPLMRQAREILGEVNAMREVENEREALSGGVTYGGDAKWRPEAI